MKSEIEAILLGQLCLAEIEVIKGEGDILISPRTFSKITEQRDNIRKLLEAVKTKNKI